MRFSVIQHAHFPRFWPTVAVPANAANTTGIGERKLGDWQALSREKVCHMPVVPVVPVVL
jgi:hypothetical protein